MKAYFVMFFKTLIVFFSQNVRSRGPYYVSYMYVYLQATDVGPMSLIYFLLYLFTE